MLGWLRRKTRTIVKHVPVLRAGFDAADPKHFQLWPTADGLSADAVADPAVRRSLRERARDQVANDSLCEGIVGTLATDLIGTGPRLRMLLEDDDANDLIEDAFADWWRRTAMTDKLVLMVRARVVDGESFGILTSTEAHGHPVTLDLKVIECDRVTEPFPKLDPQDIDGITIDAASGLPISYKVLREHPGDLQQTGFAYASDDISADFVLHLFRQKRPEQARGYSELTCCLIGFARLARYSRAVLMSAEIQASHAGVLTTDTVPDDAPPVEAGSTMEAPPGRIVATPAGMKFQGFEPTQPVALYGDFRRAVIGEIARAWSLPVGRALGDYSDSNYASGKLDHMSYLDFVRAERERFSRVILDRIFDAWVAEAIIRSDFLPLHVRTMLAGEDLPHEWRWPATIQLHGANPFQEAQASTERMANGTSNAEVEAAELGRDWQELREAEYVRAKFDERMQKKYGLTLKPAAEAASTQEANEDD